jgi:D-alanyl-D-alanine carboxypeptidase/D-alanyl-D-alanine-endopeptidase (penicillin-binding protein 4)
MSLAAPLVLILLASAPLHQMGPLEVDAWLGKIRSERPTFAERLQQVASKSLGTPYADGPLGEGPGASHDPDPLMDLTRVDCVTFVEQAVALAASEHYRAAFELLQRIRYAGGEVDFARRNHFMIADWIANNPWCVEVSGELGVETVPVTRTISWTGLFEKLKAPGLGADRPDRSVTLGCVPTGMAAAAEARLPSPALVVFVGNVDWLFALHCGLYLRDAQGVGRLFHASSKSGAVVAVPFTDYVAENATRYLGFTAYRVGEPAW